MTTEAQSIVALEAIGRELSPTRTQESFDVRTICEQYQKVKTYLTLALPFIEKLPYGSAISAAIKLLMNLADIACPAPKT